VCQPYSHYPIRMVKRKSTSSTLSLRPKKKWRRSARVQRNYITPGGELRTTLTYVDYKPWTIASNSYFTNKYACNSLYDPDITGTGNQPHDFDQYAALYGRYEVMSASIQVEFSQGKDYANVTDKVYPITGGVTMHNALGTLPTNIYEVASMFNTKTALVPASGDVVKLNQRFTPGPVLGFFSKDDVLTAGVTANPSQQAEWVVYAGNSANPGTCLLGVRVTIKYNVRFFGKKQNTGS